ELSRFSRPLCHVLVGSSRKMNQMNMCTYSLRCTYAITCFVYADCFAAVTPFGSPGLVSKPYSVIQILMNLRLNHCCSFFSKVGICPRLTFGQATFAFGPWPRPEYGWCAQASNLSL